MNSWKEDYLALWKNKICILLLGLTAAFSYGFMITHQTVGIDDTPYAYYFQEGLSAIVGRWVTFLLNKVVSIGEFSPYITDLAGVLILMAAVTVWATLFYTVLKDRVPVWGYLFFACIFLSCPLISEVYTYYLHNAVSIGYLCAGISLCFFREGQRCAKICSGRFVYCIALSVVFLWIALGCYESFMIVWLLGILLLLLTESYGGEEQKNLRELFPAAVAALGAVLLRSLMIAAVTGLFGLETMKGEAVQRSVTEMAAWMFEPGAAAEFAMVLKRIYVMYGVFAYAYLPIRVFVLAAAVMLLFGLWRSFRQRNGWIFLLTVGSFMAAFLLVIIEGKATLYRSAQFVPVICGYGALVAAYAVEGFGRSRLVNSRRRLGRLCSGALLFCFCVILWNQSTDMNRWFYVDAGKYEAAKELMDRIAYELESRYDTEKPVLFTGIYEIPQDIVQAAYVPYGSETFYRMNRLTCPIDEHLLEKFYREYGVWVAQTPALSVIDWGRSAFGSDAELVRFFRMHGHELEPYLEAGNYEAAEEYSLSLPSFPAEGSIVDVGDYIIVHF